MIRICKVYLGYEKYGSAKKNKTKIFSYEN